MSNAAGATMGAANLSAMSALEMMRRPEGMTEREQFVEAAQAFETIFLQQLFQEMRKSADMISGGGGGASQTYNEWFDQAVAESAAEHDGVGIRDVLLRAWGIDDAPEPESGGAALARASSSEATTSERRQDAAIDLSTTRRARARRARASAGAVATTLPSDDVANLERWQRPVGVTRPAPADYDPASELRGMRIWTDPGTNVEATAPGRVVGVFHEAVHGPSVEVEHPGGWISRYGGLQDVDVQVGDWVEGGEAIGRVRESLGDNYLHLEVNRGSARFNPAVVVPALQGAR